jgi:hypothetical protein
VSANLKRKLVAGLVGSCLAIGLTIGMTGCERSVATTPNSSATSTMNNPLATTDGPLAEVNIPASITRLAPSLEKFQPQVQILSPQPDQILPDDLVSVKLNVRDLPLFKSPELGLGNHLHVILDKQTYQGVSDLTQPLVFKNLAAGTHTLRVFASRPWHESFKNPGAYAQTTFHVLTKTAENNPDPQQPLLTYSRPTGTYGVEPIMLDYYLTNAPAHLATQGSSAQIPDWRIRATVNDQRFIIDRWTPIYLKGFKQGKNWVRLELIDDRGNPIPNVYNDTLSLFTYDPQARDPLTKLIKGEIDPDLARTIVDPNYTAAKPIPLPTPSVVPTPVIPTPLQSPAIVTPPTTAVKPLPSPVVIATPQSSPSSSPKPVVVPSPQAVISPIPIVVTPPQPIVSPSPIVVAIPNPTVSPSPSPSPIVATPQLVTSPSPIIVATPLPAVSPSPVLISPQPLPIPIPVVLVPAQPSPSPSPDPVQMPAPAVRPTPTPMAGVARDKSTQDKHLTQPQTSPSPAPAATVPSPAAVSTDQPVTVATPTPLATPTPIGSSPQLLANPIDTKIPTPSPTVAPQPDRVPFDPATSIRQLPAAAPVPQLTPLPSQSPISSPTPASNPQLEAPSQQAWQQKAIELVKFAGVKIREFTNTIPAKAQRFGQNIQIWAGRAIDTIRSWQNNGDNGVG